MDAREWGQRLQQWHQEKRLAHAYLVTADDSQKLHEFAYSAVGLLLCELPLDGIACGVCRSCLQMASGNHPDVEWLIPDGSTLKIQQMRTVIKTDTLKVMHDRLHIFVMEDVHKLTVEAANSILKWVEDPNVNRLFLFLTTAPAALLPTLRSRILLIRIFDHTALFSGNEQDLAVFSLDDESKVEELQGLIREFGETAYHGERSGWFLVSDKWSKWNFNPTQSLAFADLVIRYLRDQAAVSNHLAMIHRYSELALAVFQVRRQMLSHVNAQLAWETFLINAAKRGERLG